MFNMILLLMFFLSMSLCLILKKHILMLLMILEFLVLLTLMMLFNMLNCFSLQVTIFIYFLIIMVCEAILGLILLMFMVRTHGNDYVKINSLFLC